MKPAKGLYQFFKGKYPAERKFYDFIPPLLEKKYLSGYGSVPTRLRQGLRPDERRDENTIYNSVSHP